MKNSLNPISKPFLSHLLVDMKATDAGYTSSSGMALDIHTLVGFVKATQPTQWQRFEKQCNSDPYKKFYKCFEDAVQMDGLLSVMRHGLNIVEWI